METPTNLRQGDYAITKRTRNKRQANTVKTWKGLVNILSIKYWNLPSSILKLVHLIKVEDLKQNKIKEE